MMKIRNKNYIVNAFLVSLKLLILIEIKIRIYTQIQLRWRLSHFIIA